jgi:hypothetical protein
MKDPPGFVIFCANFVSTAAIIGAIFFGFVLVVIVFFKVEYTLVKFVDPAVESRCHFRPSRWLLPLAFLACLAVFLTFPAKNMSADDAFLYIILTQQLSR